MANIPEPEPTELYNAGDGIDINDRVISVKHDDTITVNEQGQLHVVNSGGGGGSDSLWEQSPAEIPFEYEWIPQPGREYNLYFICEYLNLPLEYIRDDGEPFCSATSVQQHVHNQKQHGHFTEKEDHFIVH